MFGKLLMMIICSLILSVSHAGSLGSSTQKGGSDFTGSANLGLSQDVCDGGLADCPFTVAEEQVLFNAAETYKVAASSCNQQELMACYLQCGTNKNVGCQLYIDANGTRCPFCYCP